MNQLILFQPKRLVFGADCIKQFADDFVKSGRNKALIIIAPQLRILIQDILDKIEAAGISVILYDGIRMEPTIRDIGKILELIEAQNIDSVVGIGGGSVLDVAKIVSAKINNAQTIDELFGIGNLKRRLVNLICIPSTSGTGSEVSPNAILLDEKDNLKKAVISPFLLPDAVYIDPALTLGLPPKITAETGLDALCHCIEAYTNKFAHPLIDLYVLEGIRLISGSLLNAFKDGSNLEYRTMLSMGSYYGGIALGPVNTAGVHALSYPLGGEYHISHGLANAMILPEVFEFNSVSNIEKHAKIAAAMGINNTLPLEEMVKLGILKLRELNHNCGIPSKLTEIGLDISALDRLPDMGMGVTRLLKNNPRELTLKDARNIYAKLF